MLGVSFEIGDLPGTREETACLHLRFSPDAMAMSVFKRADSYLLRLEKGVRLRPTMLASGQTAFVVEHEQVAPLVGLPG